MAPRARFDRARLAATGATAAAAGRRAAGATKDVATAASRGWLGVGWGFLAWVLVIVGSDRLVGHRAPILTLVAAACVAVPAHATAVWLGRTLGHVVASMLKVPALYAIDLAPLLLPAIVSGVFMSRGLTRSAQLFVGVALLGLTWLIIASELKPAFRVLWAATGRLATTLNGSAGRLAVAKVAGGAATTALLVVVFGEVMHAARIFDAAHRLEGWTGRVIVIALWLWLAAFILRVTGAAITWARFFASAGLLSLVARFGAEGGLLPGWSLWRHAGGDLPWIIIAVGLPVAAGLWETVSATRSRRRLRPLEGSPAKTTLLHLGYLAAILSAVLLCVSLFASLYVTKERIKQPVSTSGHEFEPGEVATQLAKLNTQNGRLDLAKRFKPVLEMLNDELYPLAAADQYLSANPLELVKTSSLPVKKSDPWHPRVINDHPTAPDLLAPPCRGVGACTLTCRGKAVPCLARTGTSTAEPTVNDAALQGTVYAHIVSNGGESLPGPNPWMAKHDPHDRLAVVVEYWLFYPYDLWEAFTPIGILRQQHEADWEFVAVGLSHNKPLFVAYSAHCGGTWANWDHALVQPLDATGLHLVARSTGPVTHPLIAVALGSHANYQDGTQYRPPDWSSCKKGIGRDTFWGLSYAANIRDRTNQDDNWKIIPASVEETDDTPDSPVHFTGYWGRSDVTQIVNARRDLDPLSEEHHGPTSPPQHASWNQPLKTFFCDHRWHGPKWAHRKDACAA